jgi:hypothetical protein
MAMDAAPFLYLIDAAAFLDRVELSIETSETPVAKRLLNANNVGILNSNSYYSRCLSGNDAATGNPVKILYGKATRLPQVPPCRMVVRSEKVPLTGAQVNLLIQSVLPNAPPAKVTLAELTSDVSNIPFSAFKRTMVHRATYRNIVGNRKDGRTLYVGSRSSPLQARIYEKLDGIVRHELVFRRGFLAAQKMIVPNDLAKLSSLETGRWLSLRKFSRERIVAAVNESTPLGWGAIVTEWGDWGESLQQLCVYLRSGKIDPDKVLYYSRDQLQLRRMLRKLVW